MDGACQVGVAVCKYGRDLGEHFSAPEKGTKEQIQTNEDMSILNLNPKPLIFSAFFSN